MRQVRGTNHADPRARRVGHVVLRVTCPGKLACRNSKAAAAEYRAIRDDLAEAPAFPPLPLFEE